MSSPHEVSEVPDCPRCGGSGESNVTDWRCSLCYGDGKHPYAVLCPDCDGLGYIGEGDDEDDCGKCQNGWIRDGGGALADDE